MEATRERLMLALSEKESIAAIVKGKLIREQLARRALSLPAELIVVERTALHQRVRLPPNEQAHQGRLQPIVRT